MHSSTMTPHQRSELVRTLIPYHDAKKLASLTDPQLHELWLILCEYKNEYAAEQTSITKIDYWTEEIERLKND